MLFKTFLPMHYSHVVVLTIGKLFYGQLQEFQHIVYSFSGQRLSKNIFFRTMCRDLEALTVILRDVILPLNFESQHETTFVNIFHSKWHLLKTTFVFLDVLEKNVWFDSILWCERKQPRELLWDVKSTLPLEQYIRELCSWIF